MRPEEKTWFNQLLLHHKDSYYNSGGSFEVGLSSNTSDFKTFSSVSLNISITNGIKKVYNLNYQNAIDLMRSFKEVTDNIQKIFESTSSIDILKRYYSDKSLKVKFANLNGDYVTSLSIINNQYATLQIDLLGNTYLKHNDTYYIVSIDSYSPIGVELTKIKNPKIKHPKRKKAVKNKNDK